ncbi:hydroxymethylbilane synthase [Georgenia sp. TF02-10]|uniref:hydroxymethylbilane synthase n=1 Tax=Georgenia sp. TF02-10 TaxID=2917725 RepID=UPI001FA6D6C2|nr:hydroxymethylbilane synthase [Georgenia sp. TF02-10]UNX54728.1 hydroxymethylbilane synthase [Georgenia sp. TF02-10]
MTPPAPLRIGTRGSDLALTQTTTVAEALRAVTGRPVELVTIRTEGDRSRASLTALGGTGVFAAALRAAVLAGEVDLAVHSLKDLPSAPAAGLTIAALPPRADARDVLCAREGWTLATLPAGARVGTGSPRRAAQLRRARPDLVVVDIRGNVGTRLGRVRLGDLDGVVLAAAGLARLGLLDRVTDTLGPDVMLPAAGQGALAVECRTADAGGELGATLRRIDDPATRLAVAAERALLRTLEAGCTAPVAAHAAVRVTDGDPNAGGREAGGPGGDRRSEAVVELRAGVFDAAGTRALLRTATAAVPGPDDGGPPPAGDVTAAGAAVAAARDLGAVLARELLAAGAAALADLPAHDLPDPGGPDLSAPGRPDPSGSGGPDLPAPGEPRSGSSDGGGAAARPGVRP